MSHLNELFEVLLFNSESYTKMDYNYLLHKDRRQGPFAVSDARAKELFGTKSEYYAEIAQTFFHSEKAVGIWKNKEELDLSISWLQPEGRKKRKNTWEVLKQLLAKLSNDVTITNRAEHNYDKITLGQLLLFVAIFRIRNRVVP